MSLVCGDIHGNYAKAKAFLEYKQEEEHVFVGDYFDSFKASDDDILQTAKMVLESDSVKLWGNHDLMYIVNTHSHMRCSGQRYNPAMVHLMESYKFDLKGAYLVDGFVITHAGVHAALGKAFDNEEQLVVYCNNTVKQYMESPVVPPTLDIIWNIGPCRGGWNAYGGIFWADYRQEKYDKRFNQVFGHSHTASCKMISVGKAPHKLHVCVDAPQFYCFNTKTRQFEDFFPEEQKAHRDFLEVNF